MDVLKEGIASGNFWKIYSPTLVVVVLAAIQALFIKIHEGFHRKKRKNGRIKVTIEQEDWSDDAMWDDIVYAGVSGSIVFMLCASGYTSIAWLLLFPLVIVGGITTTYHLFNTTMKYAPLVFS